MKLERFFSLIGLGILAHMLREIGLGKITAAIQSLNPIYMLGYFFGLCVVVVLKGLKWKMSLDLFNIPVKLVDSVRIWVIGFSFGAITPGRAGDFAKIFYLDAKKSSSLGAVLVDRITDVLAVGIFAIMAVGVFGSVLGLTYELVFAFIIAAFFALLILKRNRNAVADILLRHLVPEKHREFLRSSMADFYLSLRNASKSPIPLLKVLTMAVFIWMISAVPGLFVAKSLGIIISYHQLLLILSIAALVELIPVTVAGIGTREASVVVLMSFLGIEGEKALVFSLTNFLFGYVALAAAGYILWLKNPIKMSLK